MAYFYFVVATFPFALYFLMLAYLHFQRTPFLVDGRRDFLALALACSGFFFIGPGQLLAPWGACAVWRAKIWILVAALVVCVTALIASNLRPRLIVYNATLETLRKTLTTVALELDDDARWSGAAMNLPSLNIQFYAEDSRFGRVTTLSCFGVSRSNLEWRRVAHALRIALKKDASSRRGAWLIFAFLGATLLCVDYYVFARHFDQLRDAVMFYLSI
ncbi:MAG: hypothetical protein Q4G03_08380 [Planctomycetia bacterium]|nr:hypothetical protein [Planctomycetia bacterium]